MLAVSGIDHTIKIFSPDARARHDARLGHGVSAVDPSGFSSINYARRGFGTRRPRRSGFNADVEEVATNTTTTTPAFDDYDTDIEPPTAPSGLGSRKRMHLEYQITSQNDVDRQGGNRDAVLSRAMLAQIAARMRVRQAGGTAGTEQGDAGAGGVPMVVVGQEGLVVDSENCSVCFG